MDPFDLYFDDIILPVGYELSLGRDHDMVVWKKALNPELKPKLMSYSWNYPAYDHEPVIVKLKIPKDATVLFTPKKCRADRAIVLGFYPCAYGGELYELDITSAMSWYNHAFRYNFGQEIVPDCFNGDWRRTCSHGIHFFRNFDDAVNYKF